MFYVKLLKNTGKIQIFCYNKMSMCVHTEKREEIMKRKIRIRRVSVWNISVTLIIAVIFMLVCMRGEQEFRA